MGNPKYTKRYMPLCEFVFYSDIVFICHVWYLHVYQLGLNYGELCLVCWVIYVQNLNDLYVYLKDEEAVMSKIIKVYFTYSHFNFRVILFVVEGPIKSDADFNVSTTAYHKFRWQFFTVIIYPVLSACVLVSPVAS